MAKSEKATKPGKPTKSGKMAKSDKKAPGRRGAKPRKKTIRPVPIIALPPQPEGGSEAAVLDRLWSVVQSRRDVDPAVSHSARLLSRGQAKVAQKFGEEAVECLIEAVAGNREALIAESADVLYHLIVVWVSGGVRPDEVWAELKRREGVSGITEKASRAIAPPIASAPQTTKIP